MPISRFKFIGMIRVGEPVAVSRNLTAWKATNGDSVVGFAVAVNRTGGTVDVNMSSRQTMPLRREADVRREAEFDKHVMDLMNRRAKDDKPKSKRKAKLSPKQRQEASRSAREFDAARRAKIYGAKEEADRQKMLREARGQEVRTKKNQREREIAEAQARPPRRAATTSDIVGQNGYLSQGDWQALNNGIENGTENSDASKIVEKIKISKRVNPLNHSGRHIELD